MNFTQSQVGVMLAGMADIHSINPLNKPGRFYNDTTCIDCGMCPDSAPGIFARDDDEGYSYVWRQPVTREEIAEAERCAAECPTESIGIDG